MCKLMDVRFLVLFIKQIPRFGFLVIIYRLWSVVVPCDNPALIRQIVNSSSVVVRNADGTSQQHGSGSSKHSDSSTRQSRERKAWQIANSTTARPPSWPALYLLYFCISKLASWSGIFDTETTNCVSLPRNRNKNPSCCWDSRSYCVRHMN